MSSTNIDESMKEHFGEEKTKGIQDYLKAVNEGKVSFNFLSLCAIGGCELPPDTELLEREFERKLKSLDDFGDYVPQKTVEMAKRIRWDGSGRLEFAIQLLDKAMIRAISNMKEDRLRQLKEYEEEQLRQVKK